MNKKWKLGLYSKARKYVDSSSVNNDPTPAGEDCILAFFRLSRHTKDSNKQCADVQMCRCAGVQMCRAVLGVKNLIQKRNRRFPTPNPENHKNHKNHSSDDHLLYHKLYEVSVFNSVIPQGPLAVGASCARDPHGGTHKQLPKYFMNPHSVCDLSF